MTEMLTENDLDEVTDPLGPDESAPYGYTVDRETGQKRAKKAAGRPRAGQDVPESTGSPEDVRSLPPVERTKDREPGTGIVKGKMRRPKPVPEDIPPFRAGPIAKGMNRLYLKVGKIVRGFDPEVGQAMIDATKKESDEDVTVGEAWEELAKVNPRVRRVLLKLITGGAWGQLFMAHAPILLAVIMKPAIISHIPFAKVIESMAEPDEDTAPGEGGLPGGMTAADADEVMSMAKAQMSKMGFDLPDEMMEQAQAMAMNMAAANGAVPAGVKMPADRQVRNQPRSNGPRSTRRK